MLVLATLSAAATELRHASSSLVRRCVRLRGGTTSDAVWNSERGVWEGDKAAGSSDVVPNPLYIFGYGSDANALSLPPLPAPILCCSHTRWLALSLCLCVCAC